MGIPRRRGVALMENLTLDDIKPLTVEELTALVPVEYKHKVEDDNGHGFIFACYPNAKLAGDTAKNNNLCPITLTITDMDDDEICYAYVSGWHMCNRERWLFTRDTRKLDHIEIVGLDG